jgi:hypothetical protein
VDGANPPYDLENWYHAQADGRCFRIAGAND